MKASTASRKGTTYNMEGGPASVRILVLARRALAAGNVGIHKDTALIIIDGEDGNDDRRLRRAIVTLRNAGWNPRWIGCAPALRLIVNPTPRSAR